MNKAMSSFDQELESSYKLASSYYEDGLFSKAILIYQKILKRQEYLFGIGNEEIAKTHTNLGHAHLANNDLHEAFQNYQKALDLRIRFSSKEHKETANSYFHLGYFFYYNMSYQSALPLFQKALTLHNDLLSDNSPIVAQDYKYLGLCYFNLFNYQEAHNAIEKSIQIFQKHNKQFEQELNNLHDDLTMIQGYLSPKKSSSTLNKWIKSIKKLF